MVLSVVIATAAGESDLAASATRVFIDGADELLEGHRFFSVLSGALDPAAEWETFFSVRIGIKKPIPSGNWEVFLQPYYGSPLDATSPAGKAQPYYTRLTITAEFSDGTDVDIDLVSSPEVIGHSQSIPCTVVVWDPVAEVVVSSVEGHTLAFTEAASPTRIVENPNHTGFDDDGEFVIYYDHTLEGSVPMTEAEARAKFYSIASWPAHYIATDGTFLRGDIPDPGQSKGFSHGGRGPYVHRDDVDATNYPITHITPDPKEADKDKAAWDNIWKTYGDGQRSDSGIGPYCGNILSRGADYLRDFGIAWGLKSLAARILTQYPNPANPTSRAEFLYNYDDDAMRSKGRIPWTFVVIWEALTLLEQVRDPALDPETTTLRGDLVPRFVSILDLLKDDYDADSWLETFFESAIPGVVIQIWELGHYFQGLLVYQETAFRVFGQIDLKVHEMMVTFANKLFDETLEWIDGVTHPRGTVIYNGAEGWYLEFQIWLPTLNPYGSHPTTGIAPKLVAVYEWMDANGLNQGAKLTAIIAQYASVNYKWHYAPITGGRKLYGSATFNVAAELTATPYQHLGGRAVFEVEAELLANGNLVHSGSGGWAEGDVGVLISPDLGSGNQFSAVVSIGNYTAGPSTGTTIDVVTSADPDLQASPKVIGSSGLITAAQMETIDDADRVGGAPLVIRINPDHWSDIDVTSDAAAFFGLRFTHADGSPSSMTHRVSWLIDAQTRPRIFYHASGLKVL